MPKQLREARPTPEALRNRRVAEIHLCTVECLVLWLRDAFKRRPDFVVLDVAVYWSKKPSVCRRCAAVTSNHMGLRRRVWL